MSSSSQTPFYKRIFKKIPQDTEKHLLSVKPELTCTFSLDQIVDINDLKNSQQDLINAPLYHIQLRGNYILQIQQNQSLKGSKVQKSASIVSGLQIDWKLKFQIKREYQTELEPLAEAIGIIITFQQNEQPLELISEESPEKIEAFCKILESKFALQRNFHKIFKPLRKLGRGATATVIEGKDLRDGKTYAIKGFKKSRGYSLQKGLLFKQFQFLRKYQHPQILKLNSVFETQNSLYMVMDKYEQNLYDFLINRGISTQYQLKAILKGILQALQFLHSQGIMHRDIKPQNIMIKYEQFDKKQILKRKTNIVPVLIDFGFAQHQLNTEFTIYRCGTPGYIAPQILIDYLADPKAKDSLNSEESSAMKKYGKACDIFSLGCLFHILLTNKMLFQGTTKKQLIKSNIEAKINFTSKDYKLMDVYAKKLLFRMLEKDPEKRITASEALRDDFFRLQMFNFRKVIFRNPLLPDKQQNIQDKKSLQDEQLSLFQ